MAVIKNKALDTFDYEEKLIKCYKMEANVKKNKDKLDRIRNKNQKLKILICKLMKENAFLKDFYAWINFSPRYPPLLILKAYQDSVLVVKNFQRFFVER